MLRKIIIIRHGNYNTSTDQLNDADKKQMEELVPKLREHLAGEENILLVSSKAERAEDSMKVLAQALGLSYQTHDYFWSDNTHRQINRRALDMLKSMADEKGTDVVVLVTHLEYAKDLPSVIEADAGKGFVRRRELLKGEMVFLDMEKEQCVFN